MNTNFKRQLCLVLSVFLLLTCLNGCSAKKAEDDGKLTVIGTVFPPYDFAREIGGDMINADMLMQPGADSHSYTGDNPTDILRISKCDLFIYVGGETDSAWVEKILDAIKASGLKVPETVSLCQVCDTLEESDAGIIQSEEHDHGEHNDEDESHGEDEDNHGDEEHIEDESHSHEEEFDEHVWTSPKNAIKAVNAIALKMAVLDPENSDYYLSNADDYISSLEMLDDEFRFTVEEAEALYGTDGDGYLNRTLVFADRFPFRYLCEEYGLKAVAAFNGCASQSEPSPTTIVELCRTVIGEDLSCIFYIETSQSGVPDMISTATGAKSLLLHSCHTVSEKELESGMTYLSLMEKNCENLRRALLSY